MSDHKTRSRVIYGGLMTSEVLEYLSIPPIGVKLNSFPRFMELTGGFRMSEFSILCGATGSGKSSLLANWSADLCRQGVRHLVMSVENGHHDYLARTLSVLENEDLNTGDAIPADKVTRAIARHHDTLFGSNVMVTTHDDRIPLTELMTILKEAVADDRKLVFIDNVNFLLEPVHDKNMVVEMDRVIHEVIVFCKRNPIHLVMVMHPKKTDGDNRRVTSEFDVKGSSTAVQEASNIFLFNKPKSEILESGVASPYQREILIAKLRRRGRATGSIVVFDGSKPQYKEEGLSSEVYRDAAKPVETFKKSGSIERRRYGN